MIRITTDRTPYDWSDLAMGAPSSADDADAGRNPDASFVWLPGYGKPHADAGAVGERLPRLNDGRLPQSDDDPAGNVWFDTAGVSHILLDLGSPREIARINVYSWHSGALAPQQYTLSAALSLGDPWRPLARVDTRPLGDGGKHGSSIHTDAGGIGRYRYLRFEVPANKPEWSRSGFFSEIDVFQTGTPLPPIRTVPREPARQTLRLGKIDRSVTMDGLTHYLLAGTKLYAFGAMDGSFPRVGRDGAQGGIWCHPIQLLDGFSVALHEDREPIWRLQAAAHFEHDFASCRFTFRRGGLTAVRQDVAAPDAPALFSRVTLRNDDRRARTVEVRFTGDVSLQPSWGSGLPRDGQSVLAYQDGAIVASHTRDPRRATAFGSALPPIRHEIQSDRATLVYSLPLPPGGVRSLTFLIVGERDAGPDAVRRRFQALLPQEVRTLAAQRLRYRQRVLDGPQFTCSDPALEDAFTCAKANVLLSTMDLRPNFVAPFLAAGFPVYTWLFGCDSAYSTAGAAAAGFPDAARGTLECLLQYAARAGRGAHEVVTDGTLLGTDHVQETPQLVLACAKHFHWTGDRAFLAKAFPVCRAIVAQVLQSADSDRDSYLEGPGLMEQSGMGPERIDSVCYLYAAYRSLAEMAETLCEGGADDYRRRAAALKRSFNRDWWNAREAMWACSLRTDHTPTMDNFWAVLFPQETDIADTDKAHAALDRIEREWINDTWGCVARREDDIAGRGVGVVHNNIAAQVAFRHGRPELGLKLLRLSAKAPLQQRMLGAFDETLPGGGDLVQLWSFGPFLEAIVAGLVGVQPSADRHAVEIAPQFPAGLDAFRLRRLSIGEHTVEVAWERRPDGHRLTLGHTAGRQPLRVRLRLNRAQAQSLTHDGTRLQPEPETLRGVATGTVALSLRPRQSAYLQMAR